MTNATTAWPVVSSFGADDRRLRDPRVADQRGLDLGGREPVARHVHHVVHAAEQPDVAVVVLLGAVAREVEVLEPRPVGVLVAVRVAPDAAQHRRPRLGDHQVAARAVGHGVRLVVDDVRRDARQRNVPEFTPLTEDAARRFIELIDELYDRGINVILSAAAPVVDLYDGERLRAQFCRTESRLIEMQSEDYLAREHRP